MGCLRITLDIFSAATTRMLPYVSVSLLASAMPNSEPALAIGRSRAGTLSRPSLCATLAAGPGKRRSDDPLATISMPKLDAATPEPARQSCAALTAMSEMVSSSAAKRRSSIPETL